jgi:hypothetical protein
MLAKARRMVGRARRLLRKKLRPVERTSEGILYANWIQDRLRQRQERYALASALRPNIDVLTLVFDTPADVLNSTAQSVLTQDYDRFRWVVWNNGSRRPETLAVLNDLSHHPRVVLHRSERNLGIVRGHAAALQHCQGDYVGLLDHDDRLYSDALRIAAAFIQRHDQPALLYSDEDKLDAAGQAYCPFFKPAWSPVLLQSTGYTCHFTLFRRDLAAPLGLFSDSAVEGAQDWDLALRFHDAGHAGVHIPEVLYSWRVHAESTAGRGAAAKPYVLAAQRRCLEQSLARRGLAERYRVMSNPLYPFVDGHWHVERTVGAPERAEVTAYVPAGLEPLEPEWWKEALALMELDPRTAIVGGRVLDGEGRVAIGSPVLGMGELVGTALTGSPADEIGYFGLSLSPRNVAALAGGPWVGRTQALAELGGDASRHSLPELCLQLHARGWRIAWTPQITAKADVAFRHSALPFSRSVARRYAEWIENDPYYSPFLSLESDCAFQLSRPEERQQALERLWREIGEDRT